MELEEYTERAQKKADELREELDAWFRKKLEEMPAQVPTEDWVIFAGAMSQAYCRSWASVHAALLFVGNPDTRAAALTQSVNLILAGAKDIRKLLILPMVQ